MRTKSGTFSPPRPRRGGRAGLTLIEVVAGLALLATLLVAVLTTKARVTRQWATARQQLRATDAADALLSAWWLNPGQFPRDSHGLVPGEPGMAWHTRVVPNETLNRLDTTVVRLEVLDRGNDAAAGRVLASVEVVLDDAALRQRAGGPAAAGAEGGE